MVDRYHNYHGYDKIFTKFEPGCRYDLCSNKIRKTRETYIPRVPSAKVIDIAQALIGDLPIKTVVTGIRPGEKIHEILVSEEEANRTITRGDYHVILPILPELIIEESPGSFLGKEYSSGDNLMTSDKVHQTLEKNGLLLSQKLLHEGELLR